MRTPRGVLFGLGLLATVASSHAGVPAAPALARLEIPFVANAGQWPDAKVAFGVRTLAGSAWIMRDGGLVYAAPKPDAAGPGQGRTAVLKERLLNATPQVPRGLAPSPTRVSFFTGGSDRWRSDVPAYAGVDVGEVYPGIGLTLHARGRDVEKVFRVAPGADPDRIGLEVEGADALRVCDNGELALETALGELRFSAPVAWQERPDGSRAPVEAAYAVDGRAYGFRLGAYEPGLPLVIDPFFASTFVGGAADDVAQDMAVDSSGNVYLTGYTWSPDFPTAGSPPQPALAGNTDAFVAKLNASLSQLLAATYLGGPYADRGAGIAYSSNAAAVYVAGEAGAGFPVTAGAYDTNFHTGLAWYVGDAFVARLSPDLSTLQAATYLGGTRSDAATRITPRPAGAGVAVAGWTCSSNFPATPGAYDTTYNGGVSGIADVFTALLNPSLSSLNAATYLGGSGYDAPSGLALDSSGNVFVAGSTLSRYFPATSGAYRTNWYGNANFYDGFVSRFSPTLGALPASTFFGGVNDDTLQAAVLDPYGGIVVAGQTDSGDFPVSYWSFDRFLDGPSDACLARLSTDLSELMASTYLGGSGTESATALALDPLGYVFVGGATESLHGGIGENFPVTPTAYHTNLNADGFICRFDLSLSGLQASTLLGGPSNTAIAALAVAGTNRLLAAGATDSDAFPTTAGAYSRTRGGSNDCFTAALDLDLSFGDPALAAPGSITAGDAASAVKIPVSWSAVSGASSYTLWRATVPLSGRAVRLTETAGTAFDDATAEVGNWYYYWVSARHGSGSSPLTGPALGTRHAPAYKDYDGDGRTDLAVFETYSGAWYVRSATGAPIVWNEPWGWPGAVPVAGDFDGDALSDLAVYDRNTGLWYIRSLAGSVLAWALQAGAGASPVAADYNADGRDDVTVFFTQGNSAGYWQIISLTYPDYSQWINWGWAGGWPVRGCYQYSTRADLAMFDTGSGNWFIRNMDNEVVAWAIPWGWPGAIPVYGDYDGDGLSDLAVFDSNTGYWYIRAVADRVIAWAMPWGWPGALPMSGDYDGDAIADLTVFDTNTGAWYSRAVADRVILWAQPWGWPGAWPVGWGL